MAFSEDYEVQIRPRSGLAAKKNISVLNTPGTIDSDYRGEIKVILYNHGDTDFLINNKDRIAQMILTPVIKKWNEKGSLVFGPYPADGFFGNQSYSKFDAVLATYHDQGLIPFKTLSFGQGVNFTAGLSHVRTSPDHGTAFDVAGKGVADPSSFSEAVYRAREIFLKRNEKFS